MSQRFSLYRDQTVLENLHLSAALYGIARSRRRRRIDEVLAELGLGGLIDRLPQALPLGLRQRLALACAILHAPRVLFLDEPTAGVDPLARREFWDLVHLLAHQRGVAVLVSTHYMDEATHCDRLGFMHEDGSSPSAVPTSSRGGRRAPEGRWSRWRPATSPRRSCSSGSSSLTRSSTAAACDGRATGRSGTCGR
jgi:ABC-2 type transport system ATP-binding protein